VSPVETRSSIRRRILVLALLPLASMALILGSYFIANRQVELRDSLRSQARVQAAYLASAATVAVFAGDVATLANLSATALREPGIKSLVFFDVDGNVLYADGAAVAASGRISLRLDADRADSLTVPINFPAPPGDDIGGPAARDAEADVLGWLQLELDDSAEVARQRELMLTSLAITVLGVLVAGLIGLRMAQRVITPMQEVVSTLQLLEAGDRRARAGLTGNDELGRLAQAVNSLADRVEESEGNLQQSVDRATASLTGALEALERRNSDLEQIRIELEAALKARDAFLARVSHELRTPLTSMLGYTDLLARSGLDDAQRRLNGNARFAAELLLGTINDLLDLARLNASAVRLELDDFDFPLCLEQVCMVHAPAAHARGLELVLAVEPDVPAVLHADQLRLCQVLNNLVGNAVKFTEHGRVVLSVYCGRRLGQRLELFLRVEDTGVGIAAEDLDRIFEAFARVEGQRTERSGGTGLGLAIVKSLAELMGGDVTVSSEPGKGTVFTCQLLLETGAGTLAGQLQQFSGQRVFLCEPDTVVRRALRGMALAAACDVTVVADVQALAARVAAGERPDAILMGLAPAECDAELVEQRMQRLATYYDGPVILASADLPPGTRIPELTHVIHLVKPLGARRLNRVLAELFGGQGEEPETAPALEGPVLGGKCILLAEDNPLNRDLILQLLTELGAEVDVAEDGGQLLQRFDPGRHELLLVDWNMPVMDGITATAELRRRAAAAPSGKPFPPVALLTAAVQDPATTGADAGVIDAVLQKPIDAARLVTTLRKLLYPARVPAVPPASFIRLAGSDLERELGRLARELATAADAGEDERARSIAHQVKGLPLGGTRWESVAVLARQVEAAGLADGHEPLAQLLAELPGGSGSVSPQGAGA